MSKNDFRVTVLSVPDRENLIAEISYKGKGWVEISAEVPNEFVVAFCNKEGSTYWEFSYEEAMEVLQEAKNRLAKFQRTPEEQAEYDAQRKKTGNWKPTPEERADYEAKMEAQRKKYYD
ncbi:MAG: hypothetical protein KFB93_05825 [Simkaniaceae bacterium]|nr:MAG: hypothetical protein KFB93_05825 [Simkaniaceae bacterium]